MTEDTKFLDSLRGLAAIYVVIGHARMLLWEGFAEGFLKHPERYNIVNKLLVYFFSLSRFGHEVVIFFFVLSGFLIHLKYSKIISNNHLSEIKFGSYLFNRTKRIYPPLVFSILFTFLLDYIGKIYLLAPYLGTAPSQLINVVTDESYNLTTLLGNLLFLMKSYCPVWGSNGPLWSLKYEWWFYMLYPLILLINIKNVKLAIILITILTTSTYFISWQPLILHQIFGLFICWWLGTILADVYTKRLKINFSMLMPLTLIIPFLIFRSFSDGQLNDIFWSLGFTGFIATFFFFQEKNISIKLLNSLSFLGNFSYTLYVIHFPILVFLSGIVLKYNSNKLPIHFGYVIIGVIVSIALSYGIHLFIEKPFVRKRNEA